MLRKRRPHFSLPGWGVAFPLTEIKPRDRGASPTYEGKPQKELSSFVSSIRKISSISFWNFSLILVDASAVVCYKSLAAMIHRVSERVFRSKSMATGLMIRCRQNRE